VFLEPPLGKPTAKRAYLEVEYPDIEYELLLGYRYSSLVMQARAGARPILRL